MVNYLLQQFALEGGDWYSVPGPVNLSRFSAIYEMVQRPDLKYAPFTPGLAEGFSGAPDLFDPIRPRDVLLHHPFQSFTPLIHLLPPTSPAPTPLPINPPLHPPRGP